MTFDPTIPAAADLISNSQVDLQTNNNQSNLIMGVDHVNFNNSLPAGATIADQGQHSQTTLYAIQADPALGALIFPKSRVYSKHTGLAPNRFTELYFSTEDETGVFQGILPISLIKAWCSFDGTLATPIAITSGNNVTNVTRPLGAIGRYQINLSITMQNANYIPLAICDSAFVGYVTNIEARTPTSCSISVRNSLSGAYVDTTLVGVVIIGA